MSLRSVVIKILIKDLMKILLPFVTSVLVTLSLILVFKSSQRMSITYDEPNHYFCGLQWWQDGAYTTWPENPVLPRIIVSAGPYFTGYRAEGFKPQGKDPGVFDYFLNSYRLDYFHDQGKENHLMLIRIFVLPLFLISIIMVWMWTYRLGGAYAALIAVGTYSFTPLLMGHAGLATTDITFVATFTILIWTFFRWLNKSSLLNGVWFGIGLALAMLSKFTVLPFFGVSLVTSLFIKWLLDDTVKFTPLKKWISSWLYSGMIATCVMILVIWAFYGFHVGVLGDQPIMKILVKDKAVSESIGHLNLPAPEWFTGLIIMYLHSTSGGMSYMFGELSRTGFWYFYPVGLAIKTPIPVLLLALLGFVGIIKGFRKKINWEVVATFMIPFALMLSLLPSKINIGTRHVAAIYPFFAIGATTCALFFINGLPEKWNRIMKYIPATLLLAQIVIVLAAYPNYTNYFNVLAGKEPGRIMADSDLGWGQELLELSQYSKENNIDTLYISYFGTADECMYELPYLKALPNDKKVKGWVAVSENNYWGIFKSDESIPDPNTTCKALTNGWLDDAKPHQYFRWLDNYPMRARLAASIRVYYVE